MLLIEKTVCFIVVLRIFRNLLDFDSYVIQIQKSVFLPLRKRDEITRIISYLNLSY